MPPSTPKNLASRIFGFLMYDSWRFVGALAPLMLSVCLALARHPKCGHACTRFEWMI